VLVHEARATRLRGRLERRAPIRREQRPLLERGDVARVLRAQRRKRDFALRRGARRLRFDDHAVVRGLLFERERVRFRQ